jgi:hypothetical protein
VSHTNLPSLEQRIVNLLAAVGDPGRCRGCSAPLYWVRLKSGKVAPYGENGLNHFIDCPNAEEFKRRKEVCQPKSR